MLKANPPPNVDSISWTLASASVDFGVCVWVALWSQPASLCCRSETSQGDRLDPTQGQEEDTTPRLHFDCSWSDDKCYFQELLLLLIL